MPKIIILARSGSKRLPGKNYRVELSPGKTLLEIAVSKSLEIGEVLVSTDKAEIVRQVENYGASGMLSPHHGDTSTSENAVLYAIEQKKLTGTIILVQVTAPLITVEDIRRGVDMFEENQRPVFGAMETQLPFWAWNENGPLFPEWQGVRSQCLPRAYLPCGAFFVSSAELLIKNESFYAPSPVPCIVPPERAIDIDTKEDLEFAKWQAQRLQHQMSSRQRHAQIY
jgi:N-acylneuraminate cytidylyltransferase